MSNRGTHQLLRLSIIALGAVVGQTCVTFAGAQATVAGEKVVGVAWCDGADGDTLAVDVGGVVHVIAGGVVAVGDALTVDNQGRAVVASALTVDTGATAVTSSAANGDILVGGVLPQYVFADAMEAASGAGKTIAVLLRR